jgi:hypothetical protein
VKPPQRIAATFEGIPGLVTGAKSLFALACLGVLGLAAFLGSGASSAGADGACPNEAIRAQQHATDLGACRAWEMVSPVDKNGGEVFADGVNTAASTSGDGFTFISHSVFGDAVGSGSVGLSVYLSRRTPNGWLTHGVTPESRPEALQVLPAGTHTEIFSPDLTHALTFGYDLPGATDDTPKRMNMYLEDTANRALRTISSSQRGNGEDPFLYRPQEMINGRELRGASADLRQVAWVSRAQLLPLGAAPGYPQEVEVEGETFLTPNVYTWDDGTLHLAGILPDGTVPPEGSTVPLERANGGFRGTISADGSRQTFIASPTAGALPQLYLRIDNDRTEWISESENPFFSSEPENIHFEGMTPDGRNLFFVTDSPLLEADTNTGPDLYRWTDGPDPESNLTLITEDGTALSNSSYGGALIGMSDDGERVYVHGNDSKGKLWEEGSGVKTIVPFLVRPSNPKEQLALTSIQPGNGRVSPNGNWFAYITSPDESEVNPSQVYLYELESDHLMCVTCATTATITVSPHMSSGNHFDNIAARPHFLSDDGRVFFSSEAALVPQDVNGVYDAYEFDGMTGELRLLSSGRGDQPAMFAEASPSGDDVFFATRQPLVGWDTDGGALDFYDARSGGGFPEPEGATASCVGEACAGGSSAAPGASPSSSSTLRGAGNVHPKRPCGKNRRRVNRGGKARCVRKHQRHHNKRANTNRRAGR